MPARRRSICHRIRGTRISCYAALTSGRVAAFSKESRMKFANATYLDRKSGPAIGKDDLWLEEFSTAFATNGLGSFDQFHLAITLPM